MVWTKREDERGEVYYHNSITGESQREEPSIFKTVLIICITLVDVRSFLTFPTVCLQLRASLAVGHASSPLNRSPLGSPSPSFKGACKETLPTTTERPDHRKSGTARPVSAVREARIKEAQSKSPGSFTRSREPSPRSSQTPPPPGGIGPPKSNLSKSIPVDDLSIGSPQMKMSPTQSPLQNPRLFPQAPPPPLSLLDRQSCNSGSSSPLESDAAALRIQSIARGRQGRR